jgi:apolipoprotein N-acyltransferase
MDSRTRLRRLLICLAAIALTAPLAWGGTSLHPRWWMLWLAPLPLLWLAGRRDTQDAGPAFGAMTIGAVTLVAWFLGSLYQWPFLHGLIGLPAAAVLVACLTPAILFAIGLLIWRRLLWRGRTLAAVLFLPAYWVSVEYVTAGTSPHSTWANLAYTQSDLLPLIQVASLTGLWGISFVVFLAVSAAGVLLSEAATPGEKRRATVAAATVLIAVFAFGSWRLATPPAATGTVNVRLVSNDTPGEISARNDRWAMHVLGRYAEAISAPTDADIIMVPEKLVPVSEQAAAPAKALFANAARATTAHVIVGLDEQRQGTRRNEALLFDPTGAVTVDYEKHHFIPVLEDGYAIGSTFDTWASPGGTLGVAICKDMDFPPLGRAYGARGVGLLFVPAWDFNVDGWYHSRMAILRGVESGYTIARVAKQGLHTVTDNRGRLLLDRPGSPAGFVISDVAAPIAHAETLYVRWGDWFAWLALAAGALTLVMAFIPRRRGGMA